MGKRVGGLLGCLAGLVVSVAILHAVDGGPAAGRAPAPRWRLVPEDASGHLRRIAIHYAPAVDHAAMPVWRQLAATLPADVEIEVAVAEQAHFDRLLRALARAKAPHLERFHAVVVGNRITTWSRDRLAALSSARGGGVLTPPRVPTRFADRAGDWNVAFALSRRLYGIDPTVADYVFEGGDLAASAGHLFVDANLIHRNEGRAVAARAGLQAALARTFAPAGRGQEEGGQAPGGQEIVWLGDAPGDVPVHHIMMYMVPVDDTTVAVGDPRLGAALAAREPAASALDVDADLAGHVQRFDHVAELLAARGFRVVRFPVVVLAGAGSYVTYTNALFDLEGGQRIAYLPTYALPVLDEDAARRWRELGFAVRPIDVSSIYRMNGSLGCLVNVLARD